MLFWRFVHPTNEPPANQENPIYIYIPSIPPILYYYLYSISILPLYTLVGWTDSQNKLNESDLARPPTQKLRWTLVGQIATRWTEFFRFVHSMATEDKIAAARWTRFRSSRIRAKMAKIGTIQRARTARAMLFTQKAIISNSGPKFPISYQGKTENHRIYLPQIK